MLLDKYDDLPTLNMLFKEADELRKNAKHLVEQIKESVSCEIIDTTTLIGGGSTPNKKIPSVAVSIQIKNYSPNKIQKLFREKKIIGRIEDEKFLLDLRTIDMHDLDYIVQSTHSLLE